MKAEEKVLLFYWGDSVNYKIIDYNFKEVYDSVFSNFKNGGYISETSTYDRVELSKKGVKLFENVKLSMNEVNELGCIILNNLSYQTEECVCDIYKKLKNEVNLYGEDEVCYEIYWLRCCGYVSFIEERNDYYRTLFLYITNEGRKALRNQKCLDNIKYQNALTCSTLFTANNGITKSRDMWLLLVAAKARKKQFDDLPDFIDWAFDTFEVPFDKKDCTQKIQEKLKSKAWSIITDQISMQNFIKGMRKQTGVREYDLMRGNLIFVAIKEKFVAE